MEKKVLSEEELPPHKRTHSPERSESPEEKTNEEQSDSEEPETEVKSANNWEQVDLGDEQRKAKFLRLMGAAKTEHTGRFVIGTPAAPKAHARSTEEERNLEETLEEQYQHSLIDHLHHRNKKHRGLGFAEDDTGAKNDESTSEDVHPSSDKADKRSDK